jgi:hypothetical protein
MHDNPDRHDSSPGRDVAPNFYPVAIGVWSSAGCTTDVVASSMFQLYAQAVDHHSAKQRDRQERPPRRVASTTVRDIIGDVARVMTRPKPDWKPDITIVTPTYRRNAEGLLHNGGDAVTEALLDFLPTSDRIAGVAIRIPGAPPSHLRAALASRHRPDLVLREATLAAIEETDRSCRITLRWEPLPNSEGAPLVLKLMYSIDGYGRQLGLLRRGAFRLRKVKIEEFLYAEQ